MGAMKKIILIIAAINAVLIFFVGVMFYLSEVYPFRPGQALFPLQSFAEDERINLTSDPFKRAEKSFELVERRLSDLTMVTDPGRVAATVDAFDHSLIGAIKNIEGVSIEQKAELYQGVEILLARVEIVLSSLEEKIEDQALSDLQSKVFALQQANSPLEIQKIGAEPSRIPAAISARLIPFLDNDVDHENFPLAGGHAGLDCLDCHIEGEYANTPVECSYCHTLKRDLFFIPITGENPYQTLNDVYPDHFEGECSDCHSIFKWDGEPFNHEGITECSSCHLDDIPDALEELARETTLLISWGRRQNSPTEPLFHYPGECMMCHQDTESWKEWDFSHNLDKCEGCHQNAAARDFSKVLPEAEDCLRITECASCHVYEEHEEDYGDQCTSCHNNFTHWLPASVNHVGLENCYKCHADDKPKKHSNLMCSYCHNTQDWRTIIFEHPETMNMQCSECHQAPAGHAMGDCASCHTLNSWHDTSIFHTMSNCVSCHRAPGGHFPAVCTTCHVTTSWQEIIYSHDGKFTCSECHSAPANHYIGACDDCHFPTWWDHIDFDHTNYQDCKSCHTPYSPHNYTGAGCTDCHNTEDWYQIIYVHNVNSTCTNCHQKPSGHWSGACSRCHTVVDWKDIHFDHTGFSDCKACHTRPAGHPRSQCSRCHTTVTWLIPTPTPTSTPIPSVTPIPTEITPTPSETVEPTPSETPDPIIPD